MWAQLTRLCKETLFPCFCVSCNTEGTWWCDRCRAAFPLASVQYCPVCHVPTAAGVPCARCTGSALDRVTSLYSYSEHSSIGTLIKLFKYHSAHDITRVWDSIARHITVPANSVLVPVPLHPRRLRERGYNQAELLARAWARESAVPVLTGALLRKRYTTKQARLSRTARFHNVADAFEWSGEAIPEQVIIIDDVYTTGATMQECARVLRAHGAKRVSGLVMARD